MSHHRSPRNFCPVECDGRILVDGSIASPVPVAAAGETGSPVVVAVHVSPHVDRTDLLIRARE
ncbi:MAG TPA: hypothetical protein GXX40_00745 [Firmicutes bacterium]|nr:hypothetical protein [Bacillota bacterium]